MKQKESLHPFAKVMIGIGVIGAGLGALNIFFFSLTLMKLTFFAIEMIIILYGLFGLWTGYLQFPYRGFPIRPGLTLQGSQARFVGFLMIMVSVLNLLFVYPYINSLR